MTCLNFVTFSEKNYFLAFHEFIIYYIYLKTLSFLRGIFVSEHLLIRLSHQPKANKKFRVIYSNLQYFAGCVPSIIIWILQ